MSEATPIALVGAGVIGRRHLDAAAKTDRVAVTSIVDPSDQAVALAQSLNLPHFDDMDQMFAATSPKGVLIATPTEHHFAPTKQALTQGCHVLVEKPIMATDAEAAEITALSRAANREVLVGHHRRYYPQVEKARDLIQGGALGKLVAISGQWTLRKPDDYYARAWRKKWQAGPILTNLIHEMDYLRYICGEVSSIQAETSNAVQGYEKEDVAALCLRFASGALGAFVLSDQTDSPWTWEFATGENPNFANTGQNSIRFLGTEASLDFPNLCLWRSDGAPSWHHAKTQEAITMDLGDAYVRQIEHFADVIEGRDVPRITAEDASATLRATLAVYEAAETGQRVLL